MVFKILISIVFIAELIIAFSIIFQLVKFDRAINKTIIYLEKTNPKINELLDLFHKISGQILELIPIWLENIKEKRDEIILMQAKSLMSTILFWCINIKVIKRIAKTRFAKAAWKGLTLIRNVI